MKIALTVGGLYVSAEQGGGIDARLVAYPPALIANRTEIGPWETFETEQVDETHVALKTCNGNYVTAEGGGGSYLRTNETERGVWETFGWLSVGEGKVTSLITWDGIHMLGASVAELNVVNARHVWQGFGVEVLEAPAPPLPDLRVWKGLFCVPDAFTDIPYGDGKRIWTPAYGCYDDHWRQQIRDAYTSRGYTHFPYNCAGLPYGSDYPELADDAARVARDLKELESAGIVPVVFATDDRNPTVLCQSFVANAALIKICVPVWEMNGPLGNPDKAIEEQNCKDAITRTRNAAPSADCYLHFTPGHGSISYANEMGGWQWCQANGTVGLLAQGDNKFAAEDAKTGGEGLESTAVRLAGKTDQGAPEAWAGMQQLTVKFEYGIYDMYHGHVTEDALCSYTMEFLAFAPTVAGYCDGGY